VVSAFYRPDTSGVMRVTNQWAGFSFDAARSPDYSGMLSYEGSERLHAVRRQSSRLAQALSSYLLDSKTLHRKVEMIARIGSIEVMLVRNEREV